MHTVKCKICGKTFETNKPNVKYCGLECQLKAAARRRDASHEHYLEYQRNYYRRHKDADAAEIAKNSAAESYADKLPPAG